MTISKPQLPATPDLGGWLERITPFLDEPLNSLQQTQLITYARLLREWNEKINLTAIVDDEGIAIRHFQDSLTIIPELRHLQSQSISAVNQATKPALVLADVGTGAGFPGLVIKIACPEIEVILIDSLAKRLKFLDAVILELNLKGIRTVHARAEDAGRMPELRERCDAAVARAVAALPVLAEFCLPLVRTGGLFLAMKAQAAEEIAQAQGAIARLGGDPARVRNFILPGTDMSRSIVAIRKAKPTSPAYPRQAGKVEQTPLK